MKIWFWLELNVSSIEKKIIYNPFSKIFEEGISFKKYSLYHDKNSRKAWEFFPSAEIYSYGNLFIIYSICLNYKRPS